jgi:hypothetical protein
MKLRKLVLRLILQTTLVAMAASYTFAASQTLTGVVTDNMCGKKHAMMPGKSDSECIRTCVKSGSKYALLVGNKIYALQGDANQLDHFAGKKVKVAGNVSGSTIALASITESAK